MPNTRSRSKRVRQDRLRTLRNRRNIRDLNKKQKSFQAHVAAGDQQAAAESLRVCYAALDKAAGKNVIHENKARRRKARLAAQYKNMSA